MSSPASSDDSAAVLYTAISGGYDDLKPLPRMTSIPGFRAAAFLDAAPENGYGWDVLPLPLPLEGGGGDPRRRAKRPKVLPHLYFPDAAIAVWLDGSIPPPESLPDLLKWFRQSGADVATFRHDRRDCLYAEAAHCAARGYDNPAVLSLQTARYRDRGFPIRAGLSENHVIFWKRGERQRRLSETWWTEIERFSFRDQVSFPVVLRETGARHAWIPSRFRRLFPRSPHNVKTGGKGGKA